MKSILKLSVVLCLMFPVTARAQSTTEPERVPSSYTLTGEALVFEETFPNANLFYTSGRRLGPVGPYAYVQVGEGFSEFFVGPMAHVNGLDLALGFGAGRTSDGTAVRGNVYGFYQYRKVSAMVNHEHSPQGDWWLRAYADGEVKPQMRVGWFYQRDVGDGLRLQFNAKEAPASFWMCIDWSFKKEVFGLSYTF